MENMRIDLNPGGGVEGAQSAKPELQRSTVAGRTSSNDSAPVKFDSTIGKLMESALNSPEVREAKVEALKAQMDAGGYHASNQAIAGAVLEQLRVRS